MDGVDGGWRKPLVTVVAGTRPEAIKLAPVIGELRRRGMAAHVCATGQHRELFDSAAALFGISVDTRLTLMQPNQNVDDFVARALPALRRALRDRRPDLVVVQGDTASAFAGALAAFYQGVAVAHVEAGLRSGDIENPRPEEMHRRLITQLAALHFAPTGRARDALATEGVADASITVTGNTGIDALHVMAARLDADPAHAEQLARDGPALDPARPLVLVTLHRRENLGAPLRRVAAAIRDLAQSCELIVTLHPHPAAGPALARALDGVAHVHAVPPLGYDAMVQLMRRARLILTDSGGVQEEAPTLGVPVLVLRAATERREGLASGNALLVGTETAAIVSAARAILDSPARHAAMASPVALYGDGAATMRIADRLEAWLANRSALSHGSHGSPQPGRAARPAIEKAVRLA